MLDGVDVFLERVHIPILLNHESALGDDRAHVVHGICDVHGHAGHLHAAVERILDTVRTLETGQERGVDVDHAVGERGEQRGVNHAHVTGHNHVLAACHEQLMGNDLVCLDRIGVVLLGQRERLNARCLGALKTKGRGTAAHNELDLGIECAGVDGVDERL